MAKKYKVLGSKDGRTIYNNIHEGKTNPFRKYYAFIEVEGQEFVYDYEGKFRNEALTHFEEQARLKHGKLVSDVHVFK
jgi:curved DNA-binding protein CbpA